MKIDRRIIRTQNALWQALLDNLQSHNWDDINIAMICNTADVARSSFYGHFDNKSALLDYGFACVVGELEKMIANMPRKGQQLLILSWLVDHISDNHAFFTKAANTPGNQAVFIRFRAASEQLLAQELRLQNQKVDTDTVIFVTGGCFALIQNWIESSCKEPAETIKLRISKLVSQNFS